MMANVLNPHIDFHPRPVAHAPSPFGFGFGLGPSASTSMSTSTGWSPGNATPGHTNPAAFHQLATSVTQANFSKPQKRRLDSDDDVESSRHSPSNDDSMDRSPTPERPRRAAPKRARVANSSETGHNKGAPSSGDKKASSYPEDDVDIGVLLASLPAEALFPLLESLLKAHPSLKSTVLGLIPRPTLQTAQQALAQSARRLREAYPYSSPSSMTQLHPTFGSERPIHSAFGSDASPSPSSLNQTSMRESYIISRLGPHVSDYISVCMTYFPYFSCIPPPTQSANTTSSSFQQAGSATTSQSSHKEYYPNETFAFLSSVTNHILNQPALTRTQLVPLIMPRLTEEWKAWVNRIDYVVNTKAGMFGSETATGWIRGLDDMSKAKAPGVSEVIKGISDRWIAKVGWLAGLHPPGAAGPQPMDEV